MALNAQSQPNAVLVLVGNNGETLTNASSDLAAQRALNTKEYLTQEKGIDPSRIQLREGRSNSATVKTTSCSPGRISTAMSRAHLYWMRPCSLRRARGECATDSARSGLCTGRTSRSLIKHPHQSSARGPRTGIPDRIAHLRGREANFDVCFAFLLLPVAVPMMVLIGIAISLTSGWPLLYTQRRMGRYGRSFTIWKFRTMHRDGDTILSAHLEHSPQARAEWHNSRKLRQDPRITRIGRVLRQTSLDEIPQIFNVFAGQMSFVGPRPIVRREICKYGESFSYYLAARPGITGLWQISGRSALSYDERVILDEQYVRHWSLQADIRILLKTPRAVLRCSEAC